ncbi:hypothetical protein AGMMS4956_10450 [Bacteroidia bacterium]|nr:hypothetical protein AGMMS4956_10450 [Bacteroidia bacterium]
MAKAKTSAEKLLGDDESVEVKMKRLYELQLIDSQIDALLTLRGELPMEVQELEAKIEALQGKMNNEAEEIQEVESLILKRKRDIEIAKSLIVKYKEQQDNVRNNREHESLSKEIEYQSLEIELHEKKIKEAYALVEDKNRNKDEIGTYLAEKEEALELKRKELTEITNETKKEEDALRKQATACKAQVEPRLLQAYENVRNNARNGLAVVLVKRDACSGCFNKIPLQRQIDIATNKKVATCEYCGRFLVSEELIK